MAPGAGDRRTFDVFGAPIDALDMATAIDRIAGWSAERQSRYVCICNAHSVVTARQQDEFRRAISNADMATPDGAPVAWMGRREGWRGQSRVSGPDLMLRYFERAAASGEPVYLLGSTPQTLSRLAQVLTQRWPTLVIAGSHSPPFRPLTPDEDDALVEAINASGAGTVWVSLGCPKQELWMARHRGRIQAVMLGVGAGFDFHAGVVPRAPHWMQAHGLEWLHRLLSEPRRLWRRYLVTNTLFIVYAARQLLLRL